MDNLFDDLLQQYKVDGKYTSKIKHIIYIPSDKCPHILELIDNSKTNILISEIQKSQVTDSEKSFLIEAARRHTIFNYSRIADYYANATIEMQDLMEKSALVFIDFNDAIKFGYTELGSNIAQQYLNDYKDDQ